jgi:hypothetical protein
MNNGNERHAERSEASRLLRLSCCTWREVVCEKRRRCEAKLLTLRSDEHNLASAREMLRAALHDVRFATSLPTQ